MISCIVMVLFYGLLFFGGIIWLGHDRRKVYESNEDEDNE